MPTPFETQFEPRAPGAAVPAGGERNDPAEPSRRPHQISQHSLCREIEHSLRLVGRHSLEMVEEHIEAVTVPEVVKERAYRYSSPLEYWHSAQPLRISGDVRREWACRRDCLHCRIVLIRPLSRLRARASRARSP